MNDSTGYVFTGLLSPAIGELTISILGIVVNLLLLYAHIKDPYQFLRGTSSSFIVNIAAVDFLASCTILLRSVGMFYISGSVNFTSAFVLVAMARSVLAFFTSMSFMSFLSLSIERFASVAFPLWHRVHLTTCVCRFWLALTWVFHIVKDVGLHILVYKSGYELQAFFTNLIFMWTMFLFTQAFYFASYISLIIQRRELYKRQDLNAAILRAIEIRLKNEKNFLTTIAIVCFILALNLRPILTLFFMLVLSFDDMWAESFTSPVTAWILAIMALNFVVKGPIYLWRLKKYRKTFKTLCCKF